MQIPLRASGSSEIFPGTRGDLIRLRLITGHTGSGGKLQMRGSEGGRGRGRVQPREREEIEEAYLQPGHTHLTHRDRVNCNLPSKTAADHRQAFTWKTSGRGKTEKRKSLNMSVDNCGQLWRKLDRVHVPIHQLAAFFFTSNDLQYVSQCICIHKENIHINKYIYIYASARKQ